MEERSKKIYKCDICHKILEEKPIRLIKQEYASGNYNQFCQTERYDICKNCYKIFEKWINKHKEEIC